jgi:outer membrane lipoprotein SlyB
MGQRNAFLTLLVVSIASAGCASNSAHSYRAGTARMSHDVTYGEVVDSRVVEIEGEVTELGRVGGGLVGYSIGFERAGWDSLSTAAAAGVLGSIAGEAIERKVRTEAGIEIIVRLDGGGEIAVVQAADTVFEPGERVRVVLGREGSARVSPL